MGERALIARPRKTHNKPREVPPAEAKFLFNFNVVGLALAAVKRQNAAVVLSSFLAEPCCE
jgi:hypothetical protein